MLAAGCELGEGSISDDSLEILNGCGFPVWIQGDVADEIVFAESDVVEAELAIGESVILEFPEGTEGVFFVVNVIPRGESPSAFAVALGPDSPQAPGNRLELSDFRCPTVPQRLVER